MSISNVDIAGSGISLGLTLYSLTNEWWERKYDLDEMLAQVSQRGLGPGIEIVGFQSIRNFPDVEDAFVTHWRDLLDGHELRPTCLSSNIDVKLRADRVLTTDEMVDYLNRQLETAHKLGFRTVRVQIGASTDVLRRCLPTAEKYGITMGMEIHAPESANSPTICKVRDFYAEIGSPLLGFIPDFSSTMRTIPPTELDSLRRQGLSDDNLAGLLDEWRNGQGNSFERYHRWADSARRSGAPATAVGNAMMVFTMHGREPMQTWAELAGQIVHVHGKCYEFDTAGEEPAIDYAEAAKILTGAGFTGWISTEWEGHAFLLPEEADGFDMVAKQQSLTRRSIAAALAH